MLRWGEHGACVVGLALEAAQLPEHQDLHLACLDGVLGVSSFLLGALSPFLVNVLGQIDDLEECVLMLPDHTVAEFQELLSSLPRKEVAKENPMQTEKLVKTLRIEDVFLRRKEIKDVNTRHKPSGGKVVECLNPPIQEFLQHIPEFSDLESAELFDPEYLEDIEIENEENLSLTIHSHDTHLLAPAVPSQKKPKSIVKRKKINKKKNDLLSNNKENPKSHKKKKKEVKTSEVPTYENDELIYSCSLCHERFKDEKQLILHKKSHINLEHSQQTCKFCGKYFKKMFRMQNHLRIHTGDKPFVCHTCGKAFNQETTLRTHMRIHSGLKPFKCEVCSEGRRY